VTRALAGPSAKRSCFLARDGTSRNRVGIALRERLLTETRRDSQLVESPDYTNQLANGVVDNTKREAS
jgi:hypothetical protein